MLFRANPKLAPDVQRAAQQVAVTSNLEGYSLPALRTPLDHRFKNFVPATERTAWRSGKALGSGLFDYTVEASIE